MTGVSTIVIGSPDGGSPTDEQPGAVRVPSLAGLRDGAAAVREGKIWLLDARATPAPEALEALLASPRCPAASLPVTEDGRVVESLLGRFAGQDKEEMLARIGDRQVPLSHTHLVSLLVERAMVAAIAPPDPARFGVYAGSEWTSRLFERFGGVLVPASRVQAAEPRGTGLLAALRVSRTGTWAPGETMRELGSALRKG